MMRPGGGPIAAGGPIALPGGRGRPTTGAVGAAMPGMRPPSGSGNRPGSGARLGTGMRPPGTAMGGGISVVGGVGFAGDLNVAARPVTQQGLSGMSTAKAGPSRQVADKTYFANELRARITEITNEMQSLSDESQRIQSENQAYSNLERRYESVMKQVRALEGELADFNLALDKMRTHTNVSEVEEMGARLRAKNNDERVKVDEIFMRAADKEKAVKQATDRIRECQQTIADKLSHAGPEKLEEWERLSQESEELSERQNELDDRLAHLNRILVQHQDTINSDQYKIHHKGEMIEKEHKVLLARKTELEDELNLALSPASLQAKLTTKLKEKTEEVSELEDQKRKLESYIENMHDQLREEEERLVELRRSVEKAKKYEAVYERERKMKEFMTSYPSTRQQMVDQKNKIRDAIVAAMKQITVETQKQSSIMNETSQLDDADPTKRAQKVQEMKDDLSFKRENMKNSEETLGVLRREREKRQDELSKIEDLEGKVDQELLSLNEKIQKMQKEMSEVKSEEELKEWYRKEKKRLLAEINKTKRSKEVLALQVQEIVKNKEKMKAQLGKEREKENFSKVCEGVENKLQQISLSIDTLEQFIKVRRRESAYQETKKECNSLINAINGQLVTAALQRPHEYRNVFAQ